MKAQPMCQQHLSSLLWPFSFTSASDYFCAMSYVLHLYPVFLLCCKAQWALLPSVLGFTAMPVRSHTAVEMDMYVFFSHKFSIYINWRCLALPVMPTFYVKEIDPCNIG